MTVHELETLLRSLLHGEFASLTIGFNDRNGPNHKTVKAYAESWPDWDNHTFWISDWDRAKAIETNSWWCAHWHPNSLVGFNSVSACSLPGLIVGLDAVRDNKP